MEQRNGVFDSGLHVPRPSLAALVPPPRMHQLTYHGVLAPGSSWRSELVPSTARERRRSCGAAGGRVQPRHRYSWAELMKRVFGQDVLTCPRCGSRRRWIAAITDCRGNRSNPGAPLLAECAPDSSSAASAPAAGALVRGLLNGGEGGAGDGLARGGALGAGGKSEGKEARDPGSEAVR